MKRSDTTPGAGNAGAFEANTSGRASWLSAEHLPLLSLSCRPRARERNAVRARHPEGPAGDAGPSALTPLLAEGSGAVLAETRAGRARDGGGSLSRGTRGETSLYLKR